MTEPAQTEKYDDTETNKKSTCYACGAVLHRYALLICADCLDDECDRFAGMTEEEDE